MFGNAKERVYYKTQVPEDRSQMPPYRMRNSGGDEEMHLYERCQIPPSYLREILLPELDKLSDNAVILDVCSGIGEVAEFINLLGFKRIINIDLSREGLVEARRTSPQALNIQGCGYSLPIKSNSVELVHIKDGIVHFMRQDLLIEELVRMLKPGGKIMIVSAKSGSMPGYYPVSGRSIFEWMKSAGLREIEWQDYIPTDNEGAKDWYGLKDATEKLRTEPRFVLTGRRG